MYLMGWGSLWLLYIILIYVQLGFKVRVVALLMGVCGGISLFIEGF